MIQLALSIILAFAVMMVLSRWRLWLGVLTAGVIFGLINYDFPQFFRLSIQTFSSIPNWLLVVGVGLIPVLGSIMRDSVHLAEMLERLKKSKKLYLMITPLIFGLLPIPGGALLSCPLLKGIDDNISGAKYVVINLWFRHLLVIVYPLSTSLIIGSQLAGLSIVQAVLAMIPLMLVMLGAGYVFLLRGIEEDKNIRQVVINNQSKSRTIRTLLIFLSAPLIHIILSTTLLNKFEQLSFFIAMFVSVIIAIISNKLKLAEFLKIVKQSKWEQFSLLFLFLLLFLTMLKGSDNLSILFQGFHPPFYFVGLMAFILSFISGRVEISLSIIYPFIFTVYGITDFSSPLFAYIYFSLFAGYLISPLHPCMAFSIEYFQTSYKKVAWMLLPLLLIPFFSANLFLLISNTIKNLP